MSEGLLTDMGNAVFAVAISHTFSLEVAKICLLCLLCALSAGGELCQVSQRQQQRSAQQAEQAARVQVAEEGIRRVIAVAPPTQRQVSSTAEHFAGCDGVSQIIQPLYEQLHSLTPQQLDALEQEGTPVDTLYTSVQRVATHASQVLATRAAALAGQGSAQDHSPLTRLTMESLVQGVKATLSGIQPAVQRLQ